MRKGLALLLLAVLAVAIVLLARSGERRSPSPPSPAPAPEPGPAVTEPGEIPEEPPAPADVAVETEEAPLLLHGRVVFADGSPAAGAVVRFAWSMSPPGRKEENRAVGPPARTIGAATSSGPARTRLPFRSTSA